MSAADVLSGAKRWHVELGEALAFLASLPDACVDAIVTDPPYSSGGQFRSDRSQDTTKKYVRGGLQTARPNFAGDNRDQRSFEYWCVLWLSEALRVARPGSPICVFTDWRQLPITTDALQAGGWTWRGIFVWDKTAGCRPAMGRFASQCEYVVWGSSGAMPEDRGVGCLPGVTQQMVRQSDKHHIAGKPTAVMQDVVRICAPDGVVLDPFCGSATTGVACLREGRRFIGVERMAEHCSLAVERMAAEESGISLQDALAGQVPMFGGSE